MHWLKLFGLLVAYAFVVTAAAAPRKKIRIHIPQNVKHVYHHKKIYITNHPASSQYAPAYQPTAESDSKMPNTAFISTQNLPPSLAVFEDRRARRLPKDSSSESEILPMYRARGFYGPAPEWEDQEFDLVPPPEPTGPSATGFLPTAFSDSMIPMPSSDNTVKQIRIVKVKNPRRKKKVVRKRKPKRVIIQNMDKEETSRPLPTYHEQFYADVDNLGTIRKIKKPKRVEKIVDGDTEHIHTYSEEHIHKLVFDDPPKITGIPGIHPTASMSVLADSNSLLPIKSSQSLFSFHPNNYNFFQNFDSPSVSGSIGSLGTPSNLEYIAYDPHEVTHDHVFHDHGEIPPTVDITKESLSHPPKVTYNSQGTIISDSDLIAKPSQKSKWSPQSDILQSITTSPRPDFSYYENMYKTSVNRPKKMRAPKKVSTKFIDDSSSEQNTGTNEYRHAPYFGHRGNTKSKIHNSLPFYNQENSQLNDYGEGQISNSVLRKLPNLLDQPLKTQKNIYLNARPTVSPLFSDDFKNSFVSFSNVLDHASLSNTYDNDKQVPWPIQKKGKKKSISTQNISFGGQDHKTFIDHMTDTYETENNRPTNLEESSNSFVSNGWTDIASPSPSLYTIKDKSPLHEYYTAMALKAFNNDHLPAASNNNLQIVDAPTASAVSLASTATTDMSPPTHYTNPTVETTTTPTETSIESRKKFRSIKNRSHITQNLERNQNESIPPTEGPKPPRRSVVNQASVAEKARYPRSRYIAGRLSDNKEKDDSEILPLKSDFKYGDKL